MIMISIEIKIKNYRENDKKKYFYQIIQISQVIQI